MVFSDLFFLFVFIPAFIVCYLIGGGIDRVICGGEERTSVCNTAKNAVLIVFSLLFYAWGEPTYVLLMLFSVLVNYVMGRCIDATDYGRKLVLAFGIFSNLAILCTFKYAGFFTEQLNHLGIDCTVPQIALPIGISFYTFQSISYLVDVYRRESPVQRGYMGLLLYISMFPQLIAGPIVRYGTVAHDINDRHVTAADVADGISRFMIGLGKKVIIANQISEIATQFLASGTENLTVTGAWIGIIAFTFQIYFDFSGYSDMAIGIGRCLGFRFNENFNHPYCCNTITDFWRRWHMSLGSFFRDYVYIPLGGNRKHQWVNILIVWFLTGMWHGASWNFIIWGVYFGIIVMAEKFTVLPLLRYSKENALHYLLNPLLHVYSLILVVIGWGIFYFDDFDAMMAFFPVCFGQAGEFHDFIVETAVWNNLWLWVAAIVLSMPVRKWLAAGCARIMGGESATFRFTQLAVRVAYSAIILAISTALLVGATNNAFLYTRF